MFTPKRAKYKKQFRGTLGGNASRGTSIVFGDFGIKATRPGWISSRQLEAGRRVLTRYTQKGGRVYIRIFPDKPVSDKPPEVRMGGGKGDVVEFVFPIRPGRIIYEISGITEEAARKAMNVVGSKMPIKTKFVRKE